MTNEEAIRKLRSVQQRLRDAIKAVSRKKWRDSEKTMTVASYRLEIQAIDVACGALAVYEPGIDVDRLKQDIEDLSKIRAARLRGDD